MQIVPNFDERIPGEDRLEELLSLCQKSLSNSIIFEEDDGTLQSNPTQLNTTATSSQNIVVDELPEMTEFELNELAEEDAFIDSTGKVDDGLELDEHPDS